MLNFLITDAEFTGLIKTLRCLKEDVRLIGFCSSSDCAHKVMLDKLYVAPEYNSPNYIDYVCDVAVSEKIDYIIPVVTLSLEIMAASKAEIERRTSAKVLISSEDDIRIMNDKARLSEAVTNKKFITDYKIATNKTELTKAVVSVENPVIKPVRGENAEGFLRVVDNRIYTESVFAGKASHLVSREVLDFLPDDYTFSVPRMVMPYLPGNEWDVDLCCHNGKVKAASVRRNLDMFGGLSAMSETTPNVQLLEFCNELAAQFNMEFLICVSFKEDENGNPKLIEINPRAMGSVDISSMAGNNLVQKYLDCIRFEELNDISLTPYGVKSALFYDSVVTSGPVWHELSPADIYIYDKYYSQVSSFMVDLCFHCRIAWDVVYKIKWAIIEDALVMISEGTKDMPPFMMMPIGTVNSASLVKITETVREKFSSEGKGNTLPVYCIDAQYVDMVKNLPIKHSEVKCNPDFSDYLYDAEQLRELKGKSYSKKRNHVSKFLRLYSDYRYVSLTEKYFDECIELVKLWATARDIECDDIDNCDYLMIKSLFDNWNVLKARGGAIIIDNKIRAFAVGSKGSDELAFIHFEKADISYEGIYAAINQLVLKNEFPEVKYVNREEDLGISGLRKAKESYFPIEMIDKYSVVFG
ncbi:MAG: ATP-grasp domain-containing protein [Clostridia bacterium]|nr:ATP-grasp domain-containing protein [Clostridia bacterium]